MLIDWAKICPGISKNPGLGLIHQLVGGKLKMSDFQREVAYRALETIDELKFRGYPVKPMQVIQFESYQLTQSWKRKNQEQRERVMKSYKAMPGVQEYYRKLSIAEVENAGSLYWLKTYLKHVHGEDAVNVRRIVNVIRTHDPRFQYDCEGSDNQGQPRDMRAVSGGDKRAASQGPEHKDEQKALSFVHPEHI